MNTTLALNNRSIKRIINNSLYFAIFTGILCSQTVWVNNNLFANEAIDDNGANYKVNNERIQTRSLTEEKQRSLVVAICSRTGRTGAQLG